MIEPTVEQLLKMFIDTNLNEWLKAEIIDDKNAFEVGLGSWKIKDNSRRAFIESLEGACVIMGRGVLSHTAFIAKDERIYRVYKNRLIDTKLDFHNPAYHSDLMTAIITDMKSRRYARAAKDPYLNGYNGEGPIPS